MSAAAGAPDLSRAMHVVIDMQRLFADHPDWAVKDIARIRSDVLRLFRDVGLGIVDRLPRLKAMFIREAAGLTGEVPKLLRGEAL